MKIDKKTYFFEDNKSGCKTTENWLKKHNIEIYNEIMNNYKENDISFKEKVFLYINDLNKSPKCPVCGKKVNFNDTLNKGYNLYCSIDCTNKSEDHKENIKKGCLDKYGVESHNQSEIVKQKKKDVCLEKYGVNNATKLECVREKMKKTNIKKYGVDNKSKTEEYKINMLNKIKNGTEGNVKKMIERIEILYNNIKFIQHNITDVDFYCKKCDSNFNIDIKLLHTRLNLNYYICTNCNKKYTFSNISLIFKEFLDKNNIIYEVNNRDFLNGKEIDYYIPNNKLGIEINGLYWHSEKFRDSNYHVNKTLLAKKRDIKLLHFFENEMNNKNDIVFSIVKEKLKLNNINIDYNICEIKAISNIECNQFLIENSLDDLIYEGNIINLGLYQENTLQYLISFKIDSNRIHIIRNNSTIINYIDNGFNILLEYITNLYKPTNITIELNNRYQNIDDFNNIKSFYIKRLYPKYYWVYPSKAELYSQIELFNKIKEETGYPDYKINNKLYKSLKYLKVYDCGYNYYKIIF